MNEMQAGSNDVFGLESMPFSEALSRILAAVSCVEGSETLPIEQACGRTLLRTVGSPIDVPRQTNSAVDGYALCAADLSTSGDTQLRVKGSVFAGQTYTGTVARGECVRIMTGATIPSSLDTVVMKEHVEVAGADILVKRHYKLGKNVRCVGEDIKAGSVILSAGRRLTPPDIGLLASVGVTDVEVRRRLRIAVASTGNEINTPGVELPAGGLYDSNRYSLMAALSRPDVELRDLGILPDNVSALLSGFTEAGKDADIIISSGGVSMGDADFTKLALSESGKVDFWRIAIKPGRPLAFGHIGGAVFFGLPGNPVAVMVTFYFFVLPAIEKALGICDQPLVPIFKARTLENLRKLPGRTEIQRGIVCQNADGEWQVRTTGRQGSGILSSMSRANAFIILEHDSDFVKAGEWVKVKPFSAIF